MSLRYAITGGADQARFSIDATTGVLSFIAAPDYEAPDDSNSDHVYNVTLEATDTANNTGSLNLAITLLDANDNAPALSSSPSANIPEGSSGAFYTATAVDPDNVGTIAFSIVGGNDAGLFSIDSSSGALSVSAVDFEAPAAGSANNVYSLTLSITDGVNEREYVLPITVEDVNDNPPTITSGSSTRSDENDTATGYIASASDPDTNDTLSWGFGGGVDDALFSIDPSSGALSFNSTPDAEAPADADSNNVYDIVVQATDAGGNANTQSVSVTVDNLDDNPPVISSENAVTIDENSTASPYTLVSADVDGIGAVVYAIDGGDDAALFSIDQHTGVLSFDHSLDREAPEDSNADNIYTLSLSATDAAEHQDTINLTITVNDLNDTAPSFSSASSTNVSEGTAGTAYTATSTDPDSGDSVSYAVSGSDASIFSIDSSTGVLTFNASPDFENPADNGSDNVYHVTVIATDAANNSSWIDIAISVTDVNDEAPQFSSATSASVAEGSTAVFYAANASDIDAGDTIAFSISGGTDAALFSINANSGSLRLNTAADYEDPDDADGNDIYDLELAATDSAGNYDTLALTVSLSDVNEAPSAADQQFSIAEFATVGTVIGQLQASDPESDALYWTLLTAGSPFTISDAGEISLSDTLDFEQLASYSLDVQVSDTLLEATAGLSISVENENEIERLVNNLPTTVTQLAAEGISGAVAGREAFYNNAIAAATTHPSTLAELQALIDVANSTAELIENAGGTGAGGTAALPGKLTEVGVNGVDSNNATAYERAIAAANPIPTTTAELQAIVDEVNRVSAITVAALVGSSEGDTTTLGELIGNISGAPHVPDELLAELAALIHAAEPQPSTEAEIIALAQQLLERAANHPVVYLSLEQGGVQVQQLRLDGGTATVTANIANPVPGLSISYDWSDSNNSLMALSSVANPVTEAFSFEPTALVADQILNSHVAITRNGLRADASMRILVAPVNAISSELSDSDGDGISDGFEGELEASVNPSAANQLQTVRGNDLYYVMESESGVMLRLGSIARAANTEQVGISLDNIVEYSPGASVALVIDELPSVEPAGETEVFDFEISALPRAGANVAVVIPLQQPMKAHARYVKFHPATGWTPFVQDGLNQLRSAPALAGIAGQCPPVGHTTYTAGLIEGNACLELTIEDGGPNDADRLSDDGSAAADSGINGNVDDPGAIVYEPTGGLGPVEPEITTGVKGSGATGFGWLGLIALLLTRRRSSATPRARSPMAIATALLTLMMPTGQLSAELSSSSTFQKRWFLGAGLGTSTLEPSSNTDTLRITDYNDNSLTLQLGLDLSPHFSVEAYAAQLGSADISLLGSPAGAVDYNVFGLSLLAYANAFSWRANDALARREGLSAYLRMGIGGMHNDTDQISYRRAHTTHFALGLGLTHGWDNGLSLRAEYTAYDEDASQLSLSVVKRMGHTDIQSAWLAGHTSPNTAALQNNHASGTNHSPSPLNLKHNENCQSINTVMSFQRNNDALLADDEAQLYLLSKTLANRPRWAVTAIGHADSRHTESHNIKLSTRRVNNAISHLLALNNSAASWPITTHFMGEKQPVASNRTPQGRARNRRVEMTFDCLE